MKRILTAVAVVMLVAVMAVSVFAADGITVTLNGAEVDCSQQPATIVEGRTLVPLRAIFEALGATVNWDNATKTVTSNLGATNIELTIGSDTMYVNGNAKTLDVPGQIINSSTMVPARAIAEAYGVNVKWDAATRTVILTKSDAPDGAVIYNLSGENYATVEENSWGENNVGIQVVDNPFKAGDKVLYMETNVTDKQAWNYFWNECTYVPGQRYLVTFSVLAGNDCFGNPTLNGYIGANIRYDNADHGILSARAYTDKWSNVAVIYTVPATADPAKGFRFGVYSSPVAIDGYDHNLAWSLYFDNLSVVPYTGTLEDGTIDAALVMDPTGTGVPAGFDYDTAEGMEIDLATIESGYGYKHATENKFIFNPTGDQTDPLAYINLSADAAEYSGVAVKFKKGDNCGPKAVAMQLFFMTDSSPDISEDKSIKQFYIDMGVDKDGNWIGYFDFAGLQTADLWTGTLNKLRLDPGDDIGTWEIYGIKLVK